MQSGFPPIIDNDCTILILGSLPGIQSISRQEYYGNPHNRFWHYIFKIFDETPADDYKCKIKIALKHHIAIWDVVKTANRKGSSDSAIKDAIPNDLPALLAKHKTIKKIIFNGNFALKSYIIFFGTPVLPYQKLLSTSPACAGRDNEKFLMWQTALMQR